ncbi:hypothetical protein H0484_10495 [Pusillimonas sp. CC-YST705]|uniref:YCII-related domain-containing protein n=1 Tax=Mesopusillimonas faecipullorum TaxID=2755040 RepID=A0ABS8CED5_9BURK|nr:YciI family protein [Mesopusillimonas faecipullorum]MCB5364174.1 hypothetical protein [Mesopusillimonas faecipullorum]
MTDVKAQLAGMLNKSFYVSLRRPADLSRIDSLLQAHLDWAVQAERRGELFMSGPFMAEGAKPGTQGGMMILRADSEAAAWRIIEQDPFIKQGVFTAEVKRWVLMEGSMTVSVRFSDQSYQLR